MVKELITMNMPFESVLADYELVAKGIVDDKSFQEADTGILLSNLYDVTKALQALSAIKEVERKAIQFNYTDSYELAKIRRILEEIK